jgi:TRAP-type mannitol/chloroaromatic compound transport system permease small subunit
LRVGEHEARGAVMHAVLLASEVIDRIVAVVGRLAAWLAVILIGVILLDVASRRFFVLGSTRLQELEWHLHGGLLLLIMAYSYLRNAHVRIDILRQRAAPRSRAIIEMVGCVVFIAPFCWLMIHYGYFYALRSYQVGEVSAALTGLPARFVIKSLIPIGFVLIAMAATSVFLKCFVFAFGPEDLRQRSGALVLDAPLVEGEPLKLPGDVNGGRPSS